MTKPQIVLIEDSPTQTRVISKMLTQRPATVHMATTIVQAVRSLEVDAPAAVMLDINLPGAGGIYAIAKLGEIWPSAPIIAMSTGVEGQMSKDDTLKAARLTGAKAALAKPFSPEELMACVATVMPETAHAMTG